VVVKNQGLRFLYHELFTQTTVLFAAALPPPAVTIDLEEEELVHAMSHKRIYKKKYRQK
jgi:hypothetical protein